MNVSINWLPEGGASNHERVAIMPALSRLAAIGTNTITCRHPTSGKLYQFESSQDGLSEMAGELDVPQVDLPTEGEAHRLVINTRYRDGNNFKTHAEQIFEGKITHESLDTLLTALFQNFDGIIPHQINMEDHQGGNKWKLDYDGPDHPWHEITDIEITQAKGDGKSLSVLLAQAEDIAKEGWDPIAAIIRLKQEAGDEEGDDEFEGW